MTPHRPNDASELGGLAQLAEARRLARSPNSEPGEEASAAPPGQQAPSEGQPAAAPFQFGLRAMLVLVACLSGLLAVMHVVGAVWSAILIWFLLLATAHVTANFWGTSVAPRAGRGRTDDRDGEAPASDARPSAAPVGAVRLRESSRPGWPMLVATAVGACLGGALGGAALVVLSLDRAGYAGVVVGSLSAAAVGGFVGFLTSSFAEIALGAWNEAAYGTPPPRDAKPHALLPASSTSPGERSCHRRSCASPAFQDERSEGADGAKDHHAQRGGGEHGGK